MSDNASGLTGGVSVGVLQGARPEDYEEMAREVERVRFEVRFDAMKLSAMLRDVAFVQQQSVELHTEARTLQAALDRWLPHVRGDGSERDEQAATDAYLLVREHAEPTVEYGEQIATERDTALAEVERLRAQCETWSVRAEAHRIAAAASEQKVAELEKARDRWHSFATQRLEQARVNHECYLKLLAEMSGDAALNQERSDV